MPGARYVMFWSGGARCKERAAGCRPEGIWLGHGSLPARLRILEIGGDYILGVEQDDLDVERVVLYEFERERGRMSMRR